MKNVKNEYGISKSRKVEILTEMGYKLNPIIKGMNGGELYVPIKGELSLSATKSWIYEHELEAIDVNDNSFRQFIKSKLNK